MKIIYLECTMGAAGDMLMSALLELLDDKDAFVRELNNLGLPEVAVTWGTVCEKRHCGNACHRRNPRRSGSARPAPQALNMITAMSTLEQINQIIMDLPVSDFVRANALAVYNIIAEAEAKAHGKEVEEIHFHEVGSMDAVTDIVGVTMLLERLSPDQIVVSPVHVGSGQVFTVHGTLPVPAPATAYILLGIPHTEPTSPASSVRRQAPHCSATTPIHLGKCPDGRGKDRLRNGHKEFCSRQLRQGILGSAPGEAG